MCNSRIINLTFFYREGCWMCDKAEEMLNGLQQRYHINMKKISIDSDEELYELYQSDIPVIEFQNGSTLHGAIRKKELVKMLDEIRDREARVELR